ncbi:MAG: histidinol dehydrogenase [Candidatus Aenigmarchaeota archaeon ex4484_52]|nr:MAG: histidinol dehydrogenase [Candidatus Aenigmarchaeota archaeon ex4484_52]
MDTFKKIIKEVKTNGDWAVKKYTKKFDNLDLDSFEISKKQIQDAYKKTDTKTIRALKKAISNIKFFAKKQMSNFKEFEIKTNGVVLGQKIIPIQTVGCYVPGGRFPLASSALMSIIPAKTAGVENIIVCSPKIKDVVIVASDMAGADRIFNIGGIQAIAALAFGTKNIPKANKIIGPGNKYVAAAKKEVYGTVGIDFIASASEILIIADESTNPKFIAADLLAQAEHDVDAKANLITDSLKIAKAVNIELNCQIKKLKTKSIIRESLKNSKIILVENLDDAVEIANKYAPEHLELQIKNPDKIINKLKNYGGLFIGKYSAEVFGDYCVGPNHILPTNKAAKYTGGLSVGDFLKIQTYQKIDKCSDDLIKIATSLAEIEGLDGHKNAALIRLKGQ